MKFRHGYEIYRILFFDYMSGLLGIERLQITYME